MSLIICTKVFYQKITIIMIQLSFDDGYFFIFTVCPS